MKQYKGFFKILGGGIVDALVLILRGLLGLAYIVMFCIWVFADAIARGLNFLIKCMDKAYKRLKNRDK